VEHLKHLGPSKLLQVKNCIIEESFMYNINSSDVANLIWANVHGKRIWSYQKTKHYCLLLFLAQQTDDQEHKFTNIDTWLPFA
jgi:hypothetical protein